MMWSLSLALLLCPITFALLMGSVACDNIASVLASPDDPRLGMAASAADKLSGTSFGYHHVAGGFLVDNIRWNDHLQCGSLQERKREVGEPLFTM